MSDSGAIATTTASNVNPAPPPIQVTDDTGRNVRLSRPAERIVTLSPHATELVFAAGAGDRLVAVAPYSDFPPAAARLPLVGGLAGLDRERLLALAPDLVVAWDSGNKAADLAWLDSLGIALFRSEPRQLDDIATNLLAIGRLTGQTAQARQAAARYRHALTSACPQPLPGQPTAFIQLAARPLLTVGGAHWLDRAVARAGLRNVFGDLPTHAMVISPEALLTAQPAVHLYLDNPGTMPPPANGARVIGLDPALWSRPGPRLPAGIAALCRALTHSPTVDGVTSAAE